MLASPALRIKLYVPFARTLLKLRQALTGPFLVNSYVRPGALPHDPERVASYAADPPIARPIASHMLLGLHDLAERIVADARAITVPTQLFISAGSAAKEPHVLPGFRNDTLGEFGRAAPIARIRRFLDERFAAPPAAAPLLDADRTGHARDEADRPATPPRPFSLGALRWRLARLGLAVAARFSAGIR